MLSPTIVGNGAAPPRGVQVGSGVVLTVAYTADLHFRGATGLRGFKDVDGIRTPATVAMTAHSTLVVDGLAPHLVLLSVRKLRELDATTCFFSADNQYGVDNCLRLFHW